MSFTGFTSKKFLNSLHNILGSAIQVLPVMRGLKH